MLPLTVKHLKQRAAGGVSLAKRSPCLRRVMAFPPVDAEINGQPVRLQIDLGSGGAVSLSDDAWKRIFPNDGHATKGVSLRIEGADLPTRQIAGNKLTFAGADVEGVPVENSGPLPGNQDGLLGQAILGKADIILDIPAKKLILIRNAKTSDVSGASSGENAK